MTPSQIKKLREAMNLTQAGFGKLFGVDRVTAARWEIGDRKPRGLYLTRLKELAALAQGRKPKGAHVVKYIVAREAEEIGDFGFKLDDGTFIALEVKVPRRVPKKDAKHFKQQVIDEFVKALTGRGPMRAGKEKKTTIA